MTANLMIDGANTALPPVPPWFGELIDQASGSLQDMLNERGKIHELVTAVYSRGWEHFTPLGLLGHIWDSANPTFPPIAPHTVDWLVQTAESSGTSEWLATYALNPTRAGFPKKRLYDAEGQVLHEAFRIVVRAAALRPPQNHDVLWKLKAAEMELEWQQCRCATFNLLTAGWSGVSRSQDHYFPTWSAQPEPNLLSTEGNWTLFERLLRNHPFGNDAVYCDMQTLAIQAAFVAWKHGQWTATTMRSLLDASRFDSNVFLRLKPTDFHTADPSFPSFVDACQQVSRDTLDSLLADNELELAACKLRDVEPSLPAIEVVLKIGQAIESGATSKEIIGLMRPLRTPADDTTAPIEKLKQLDTKALLALIQEESEWVPLILEALPDRRLAEVLKTVIGTFYSDLLPAEIRGWPSSITYPSLYPGRSASGFTNLQPFFDMLASTSLSVIKKALPILRRSDPCNEHGPNYVTHHLGLPPGRRRKHGVFYEDEWFVELSRRIPRDLANRETLLAQRVETIAVTYFEKYARKTVPSEPTYGVIRAAMCAHAESAGFPSTEAALLDSARRWALNPELVRDGLTLRKSSNTPEGIVLMKGKRSIQNLPPALRKDAEVTRFRAEAFALWQTRLLFEADVMPHYLKTGELQNLTAISEVFGCQASETLRRRLEISVPRKFEKEFRGGLESEAIADYPLTSILPFNPATVVPELIRRGWEHMLGRCFYEGFFFTTGEGKEKVTFLFKIISVTPRDTYKESSTPPNIPHTLALSRGSHPSATPDYSSEYCQRVIDIVLRDLVDTLPVITS
ncbi:MAG TPA: hypothetical protein VF258_09500 [Luteolibacter sp.]